MPQRSAGAAIAARVSTQEHEAIRRLADAADRSPSREVRRAIRFYLAHVEQAEQFFRQQTEEAH